jgi:inorganic pyrophosphatase
MMEHLLEIKIVQPGRATGQYFAVDSDTLRLEKIVYPDEPIPFDVGILPTALTPFDEPLAVLVLGSLSHPMNTELESRLLGAIQRNAESPILLATPVADDHTIHCLDELSEQQRTEIITTLHRTYSGDWKWLTIAELESQLHTATLRYRQKQARGNHREIDPAWKPLHLGRPFPSFAEAERYTAAEYTFFELPFRFQHYVNEHLAPDERILYALRRPSMISQRTRSVLRREQLQEGVLILTDQRLIHLAELVPPDSANIRYGFHTSVGALERLAGVSVTEFKNGSLLLTTTWNAHSGNASIEWELPHEAEASLDELTALLKRFIVDDPTACRLRRAGLPEAPDKLPPLEDTTSSNPDNPIPINGHFSTALTESLSPDEKAYTWAFLPEWVDQKKGARVLVVTDHRIFMLPDHSFDVSLGQITTLEYTGSILRSSLAINYYHDDKLKCETIFFPYPTQDAFRSCFESARRCMAVIPLSR